MRQMEPFRIRGRGWLLASENVGCEQGGQIMHKRTYKLHPHPPTEKKSPIT